MVGGFRPCRPLNDGFAGYDKGRGVVVAKTMVKQYVSALT